MSNESLQQDVLRTLGDDRLTEMAGTLGTDPSGVQSFVSSTLSALDGDLPADTTDEVRRAVADSAAEEPPLQGVAAFGGLGGGLGGGLAAGVFAKVARPLATAVARRTGLPEATVRRALDMLLPVVLAALTRRAAKTTTRGPGV
ncbi:DUF937 domain-containing protein [Streptomyces sp. NPDC086787]|uniref:DUF937 domain-containing protein n=1 Tax=Streptomyces sp. NPDC086787 TaxID=3365759 RepID=UPI0037F25629